MPDRLIFSLSLRCRYPPYGRCLLPGPEKGWGTCMAPFSKKPTLSNLEASVNKQLTELKRKMHQHQSRANLLYKRCEQSKVCRFPSVLGS